MSCVIKKIYKFFRFKFQAALRQQWEWWPILCKLGPFATSLNINVSVLTLAAINLDRFYAIFYPLKPKLRFKQLVFIIIFIWLLSIVIAGYNLFCYRIECLSVDGFEIKRCDLVDMRYYQLYLSIQTLIQFILPLIIICFSFVAIYYRIKSKKHSCPLRNNIQIQQKKNRKKAITMILIVLIVFLICWTPLQVYNVIQIFNTDIN